MSQKISHPGSPGYIGLRTGGYRRVMQQKEQGGSGSDGSHKKSPGSRGGLFPHAFFRCQI